jgi:uncharacterized membrane protein YeiH
LATNQGVGRSNRSGRANRIKQKGQSSDWPFARHFALTERAMQWPDAIGLGLFTAGGSQLAIAAGMPAIVAVLMGMITAVFGGVLRDIVCNEIPQAFRDHRPYAVCSFAGGWVVVAADLLGLAGWVGLLAGASLATVLRGLGTGVRLAAAAMAGRLTKKSGERHSGVARS